MFDANALRQSINQQRRQLSPEQIQASAISLAENLVDLPELGEAKSVAGYMAVRGEMDLLPSFAALWHRGVDIYLPIIEDQRMYFAKWQQGEPLAQRAMGLLEPDVPREQWRLGKTLDAVLAPLVAFDKNCNRMGMGGGFYDRAFAGRLQGEETPHLLGVAHDFQACDALQVQPWDVPMNGVVTASHIQRKV